MSLVQRLFNTRMLPAALPRVIEVDSQQLRGLFREIVPSTLPLYQSRKPQAWTEAIADLFQKKTGHQVKINEPGSPGSFGPLGSAIAQRITGTHNTRISTHTSVPIFDLCHELVHALQNTFKALQEPLSFDFSTNAIGTVTNSSRVALNRTHEFFMQFRKSLYVKEQNLPSKMPEILSDLETFWSKLPKADRQQIMMYYLQECQAQGIPLEPLKPVIEPLQWGIEKRLFHNLRQFLKALIDTETKLGQNKGFQVTG
jgi:hypothetical protein